MRKPILPFLLLICVSAAWSQNSFQATVKDEENKQPLVGANVILQGTMIGAITDGNGFVELRGIPDGEQRITFSYIGYGEKSEVFSFPLPQSGALEVLLHSEAHESEEITVTATRSSRTIADIPTRIEAISGEELDEKGNMKPGDIRMLLNESTGIQTQQTSATSFNSSIRIQGLDGKYTQILKDGFPLYAGFSGGLSLLQIVPLDLKQVEVIKGASSTLHGGGAIAGLVNLVSRAPTDHRQVSFLLNGTSASGLDASAFYAQKLGRFGTTAFASYNLGTPYDPADIGLTAIPEFRRYTLNPKLFFYMNDRTTFNFGFNTTIEDRTGGDMKYVEGNGDDVHSYFERNETTRFSTQFGLDHQRTEASKITLRNSVSYYDRSVEVPDFEFAGTQVSSFSEATYSHVSEQHEWIAGLNLWTDRFVQDQPEAASVVDYDHTTVGAFVQNTWNASESASLETGLRLDHQDEYGSLVLPRIALLMKVSPKLTLRLGGGLGYKTPTVFTEDAERLQFRDVLPVDAEQTKAEESIGTNFDVNYRTMFSDMVSFSINSLLFYTRVNDPLVLTPDAMGLYEFRQPGGYNDTKGVETNIKLTYDHFKLFIGHTFADVKQHSQGRTTTLPLVARNRLNNVLIYEIHDKLRIGLEGYYFGEQELSDGRTGRDYWIFGLMTERIWDGFSLFLNFENFLDTRQTGFETIYTGPITNPTFSDIYAPLDGFVVNGGLKVRL
jgi:outer membrane receptor for ferrienterochelin and colicins